jgi:hypothetical protein
MRLDSSSSEYELQSGSGWLHGMRTLPNVSLSHARHTRELPPYSPWFPGLHLKVFQAV